jgi:protein gp37
MAAKSDIQWTDATWSPIRARVKSDAAAIARARGWLDLVETCEKMAGHVGPHCEFISSGCNHCYACMNNHRCLPNNGTGLPFDKRARELVDIFIDEKMLQLPFRWKRPRKIFVENQSDLFGHWVPFEMVDQVSAVMALTPHHTYQILTKRPERMREYFAEHLPTVRWMDEARRMKPGPAIPAGAFNAIALPNVWVGVSAEDQKHADERIPLLLETPAAVRFVSYEPALGPVNFDGYLGPKLLGKRPSQWGPFEYALDWVILGGESGNGARPFDIQWALDAVQQCTAADVKVFVKQLGKVPIVKESAWRHGNGGNTVHLLNALNHKHTPEGFVPLKYQDSAGGDIDEFPPALRVRQFPGETK